jgi:hypothetical protein
MTNTEPVTWRMVTAGHYEAGDMEIRRDPNASPDNRWSLRVPGHKWTSHRLLKSAKTRGMRLHNDTSAPVAYTQQPQQQAAQADQPAPAGPRPADAIRAHMLENGGRPTASQVVQRGVDLDELHRALDAGAVTYVQFRGVSGYSLPIADRFQIDDVVFVTPSHGRQFDVIEVHALDEMIRVMPRNPGTDDRPQWVGVTYAEHVPARHIEPVEDDEQPECEGHESLAGEHMGEGVYCDGSCVRPKPTAYEQAAAERAAARREHLLDPDQLTPFVVGALVVRQSQPGMVWRITGHEVRGGVTPDAYALLEQPFTGAKAGAFVRDLNVASIAEGLRATAPMSYREALSPMLTAVGFELGTGRDDAFAVHEGSGVEVGVHAGGVRLSYPAEHGGAIDDPFREAFADVEFGTRYEVIVDLAVGLIGRVMREGHARHNREVADALRDLAGHPLNRSTVMVSPIDLRAFADELVIPGSECPAAAYARRTTAVVQGVIMQLMQLGTNGSDRISTAYLRGMALNVADLMTTPEPHTADQVAEHLRDRGTQAAIVADESLTPADVDGLIDTLVKAGWTLAPEPEFVGGKRVRYLMPADGAAALLLGKAQPVPAPGHRIPYVGDGVDGARRSAEIDRAEADTHPTDSPAWQRCMDSAARWEEQAEFLLDSALLSDDSDLSPEAEALLAAGGITVLRAEDIAGAGMPCGCDPSWPDHRCGPSAPDTFDPSSEV